jgi:uncharacterized protein (TIGR00730 family)
LFAILQEWMLDRIEIGGIRMKISVFGGSQPRQGQEAYAEAMALGGLLAGHGHTVLTGGYMGTMEAVSRGAREAGGHVIGVTSEEIEAWRPVRANAWVAEEIRTKTLMERLSTLIHESDAALALPGGPGTLTEISLTWNLMIVESLHRRPLILIGEGWQSVFDQFFRGLSAYVPDHQREILRFAKDVRTAVDLLESNVPGR